MPFLRITPALKTELPDPLTGGSGRGSIPSRNSTPLSTATRKRMYGRESTAEQAVPAARRDHDAYHRIRRDPPARDHDGFALFLGTFPLPYLPLPW